MQNVDAADQKEDAVAATIRANEWTAHAYVQIYLMLQI